MKVGGGDRGKHCDDGSDLYAVRRCIRGGDNGDRGGVITHYSDFLLLLKLMYYGNKLSISFVVLDNYRIIQVRIIIVIEELVEFRVETSYH